MRMGIQGLLPALKSITVGTHVKHYAQQTLGVDAYVWLHRGAFACAMDLALGKHATKYVDYAMHRVRMLKHYGVTPYIVFDGDFLPSKSKTERERAFRRDENKRLGKEYLSRGNTKLAQEYFQKAIDITPDMALRFILALQAESFDYIVAPYEADAQLAYLERIGIIDGVITEDSDLLVFGCRKVLYKMNEFGECMEVSRDQFTHNTGLKLNSFDDNMFRYMAILSGCDYLENIPGMGLKNAHRLVRKHRSLEYILKALKSEFGFKFPGTYEQDFRRANLTFVHQWVFCPLKQALVMGAELTTPLDEQTAHLIGTYMPDETARAVAKGIVDPITKKPIILEPIETTKRPTIKHSKSAPPIGNTLMDTYLRPRPATAVLSEISTNVDVQTDATLSAKRTAPRPSLREQAQLKKLKLFESSPSPPSAKGKVNASDRRSGAECSNENKVSTFFSSRQAISTKASKEDRELEVALAESIREEQTRREFDGFQNPIAFEVQESLRVSSVLEDAKVSEPESISKHFPACDESTTTSFGSVIEESSSKDAPASIFSLPTPPNSQDLGRAAAQWRNRYAFSPSSAASDSLAPHRPSSIGRMRSTVLTRQASLPNLLQSPSQRRAFTVPSFSQSSHTKSKT